MQCLIAVFNRTWSLLYEICFFKCTSFCCLVFTPFSKFSVFKLPFTNDRIHCKLDLLSCISNVATPQEKRGGEKDLQRAVPNRP